MNPNANASHKKVHQPIAVRSWWLKHGNLMQLKLMYCTRRKIVIEDTTINNVVASDLFLGP